MRYLSHRKNPEDIVDKHIDAKAVQAIRQVMNRGIEEANKSYNSSLSYMESQRRKSFSYGLHKTLTKIFKEDPIGKHIEVSTNVRKSSGIYNRLEFICGKIVVSVVKAEKDCLPIESDYKRLLSKQNLCLNNQLVIGMNCSKEEFNTDKYYAFLTYDLIHDGRNKRSKYSHLDLIIPDHEYQTILYTKEILKSREHLSVVESRKPKDKKNVVAKKSLFEIKKSSDTVE